MSEPVCEILCRVIQQYGRSLVDDPRRCEGLLRDLCPQAKREVHVLAVALRERVPADLLSSQTAASPAAAIERLARKLETSLGLAAESARWAVESWALALGIVAAVPPAPDRPVDEVPDRLPPAAQSVRATEPVRQPAAAITAPTPANPRTAQQVLARELVVLAVSGLVAAACWALVGYGQLLPFSAILGGVSSFFFLIGLKITITGENRRRPN